MSLFLKDQWQEWAREWGLEHEPQKGLLNRTERVVGERKGLLIRVGWGTRERPGLITCIRFPRVADPDRLRQALIEDETLDALPGKGSTRRRMALENEAKKVLWTGQAPEFVIGDRSLVWRRAFPWSAPKAAQVASWVDLLVESLARSTPVFDGRCESCGTGVVRRYVRVDDLPMMLCTTCQQRMQSEGEMADRAYEMIEARHAKGATYALLAAMAGALAWAAIGALTEHMFAAAAIGIGALVAWAYRLGAGRVDRAGRLIAGGLTLFSVVAGEILLYSWWVAKANPEIGYRLDAGWYVYVESWAKHPGDEVLSLFFGLIGAWVAGNALQRPKLRVRIESPGEGGQREAA